MDILVIIVRECPLPLPQTFISELFPAVVNRVLSSDDSALLQVSCNNTTRHPRFVCVTSTAPSDGKFYNCALFFNNLSCIRTEGSAFVHLCQWLWSSWHLGQ